MSISNSVCPNCGETADFLPLTGAPAEIARCTGCQGWGLISVLKTYQPESIYSEDYFSGAEYLSYAKGSSVQMRNFRRKIRIIQKSTQLAPREWRILELGSATGEFLETAKEFGVTQTIGIEISDWARNVALKKGQRVFSPESVELKAAIADLKPNVLVAWDVWEHLDNSAKFFTDLIDSIPSLEVIAVSTVDSGSWVAKRKGTRWRQFHPPSHLNYPTRGSLRTFFSGHGFESRYQRSFGYERPLAEYLVALFPKFKNWVLNSRLLFKIPIYLNLYDSQILITKKRSTVGT